MPQYLLGLDNGSTVIKAGLYCPETGEEIASAGVKCDHIPGKPGHYERDMDEIFAANVTVIRNVMDKAGIGGKDVFAVATSGHGNGAHLVDADGRPVGHSIEASDSRAADYVAKFYSDGTFEKVHPLNNQALWPGLSCLLLAWMADNEPERVKKARWYFNVGDFVRFRLTGVAAAETTTMSGTGLVNHVVRGYDKELLGLLGIADFAEKLPPLVASTDMEAKITPEAAALTGLAAGTPVAAGLYDIDAASLACKLLEEGVVTVVAGSWANNLFVSRRMIDNKDLFSGMLYAKPEFFLFLEGSPTGSANLEWFVDRFMAAEAEEARKSGASPYAACDAAIRDIPPEESDIVFTPFLYGYNAVRNSRAMFVGMEGLHRREHLIRAVCEGICFSHRWHIDRIGPISGTKPTAARMAGGGAKSPEWVRMYADVLNLPVQVAKAKELGTLGAAMCAGVAAGVFADFESAADRMAKMKDPVLPNPRLTAVYDKKYANYLRAVEASRVYWPQ